MGNGAESTWPPAAMGVTLAFISASAIISLYLATRKSRELGSKVRELEASLAASLKNTAAERKGRIRAQQALRQAIAEPKPDDSVDCNSYPMTPIGVIHSSFSTRNGTPRQSLVVPLARARLVFSSRIPPASIEGLGEYSHCWIIYVFHLNTNLEKSWKDPRSKFKAKVKVPRLKGAKLGVFATRSPHRPCPIGLTIAKVEAIQGHQILFSGGDLVDGTPVLDVKPYLPYCDSLQDAKVPEWIMGENLLSVASICYSEEFTSTLMECWPLIEKESLYESVDELKKFVKQVLSWDIRSLSQRSRPHDSHITTTTGHELSDGGSDSDGHLDDQVSSGTEISSKNIIYHLLVDGLDVSYTIDCHGDVVVGKVALSSPSSRTRSDRHKPNSSE